MSDGTTAVVTPTAVAPAVVDTAITTPATTQATVEPPVAVAAPAPEVIADPAAAAPADNAVTFAETGDAGLDVALAFIGGLGIGLDHPAVTAAADGKFDLLEATLAAMGDTAKGHERMVQLAKEAYGRTAATTAATQTAVTAVVHEAAGSAEHWSAVKTWASANADPAEREAINAMLSAGPVQARAAAIMLTSAHASAGGTVVKPADPTLNNAGITPTTSGALSPAEYGNEVRNLRTELGSRDLDSSPKYHALQARRLAWQG